MDGLLYFKLSALMFMEYAIWGAWMPVLAARLLGPLKLSGKQTGWIYATLPLATMISPLIAGELADKYLDTRWILLVCHGAGAILLFVASRQKSFVGNVVVMFCYSLFYGATIPLVNSLMFSKLTDPDAQSATIFIWAPIAWALAGYALSGWRLSRKKDQEGDGSDCLIFAAALSAVMVVVCAIQPATPPAGGGGGSPMLDALGLLSGVDFAVFAVATLLCAGMMQFYFMGSAQYMQDLGVSAKAVPASMALAQLVQAVATFFALALLVDQLGYKWTLVVGAGCWLVLFVAYVVGTSRALIIGSQPFHGLAYVFFIIVGQLYVNAVAPPEIRGSAQSLVILIQTGISLFLGTQLAGFVMDMYSSEGKFQWRKIWIVPAVVTLVGTLALAAAFQGAVPEASPEDAASSSVETTNIG